MKRYTVGEVSRITGISRDMLRFYDKIGLVKPAYINRENKYRYYTYDQFWLFDIIQMCRDLDIPLKKIRIILESKDDKKVMQFLEEHQKEAIKRSQYFQRVADDIDWYAKQQNQMQAEYNEGKVTVCHLPQRKVLLGKSDEDIQLYHLDLQELCNTTLTGQHSFCRHYGFVLDVIHMKANRFIKQAEYLHFEEDILQSVSPTALTTLPEGDYACAVVNIINDTADFSTLLQWCKREKVQPEYVIADEIGLHLFHYWDQSYLCEVKVFLK